MLLFAVYPPPVLPRPAVRNGRNLPADLSQDWDAALALMSGLRSSVCHKQLYGGSDPTFPAIYGQNNLETNVVKNVLKRGELLLIGLLSNIIVEILRSAATLTLRRGGRD